LKKAALYETVRVELDAWKICDAQLREGGQCNA